MCKPSFKNHPYFYHTHIQVYILLYIYLFIYIYIIVYVYVYVHVYLSRCIYIYDMSMYHIISYHFISYPIMSYPLSIGMSCFWLSALTTLRGFRKRRSPKNLAANTSTARCSIATPSRALRPSSMAVLHYQRVHDQNHWNLWSPFPTLQS